MFGWTQEEEEQHEQEIDFYEGLDIGYLLININPVKHIYFLGVGYKQKGS